MISVSSQIKVAANTVQSSSKKKNLGCFKSIHLFYVHISVFFALPRTSICLPCPGKKMLFIAKHCAEMSPRCFQMYSAPCSACLYSASSPRLGFSSDLSLLCYVPEAAASFSITSRGAPRSPGDAWAWLQCGALQRGSVLPRFCGG